jgi:serine/threonine protein kinase
MDELLYVDEKFPSYQMIELLSANPTSSVFLAERDEKLYVIKEQPKAFCYLKNPTVLRELNHPGLPMIVDFYESGESFFYSYEYIHGVTLTEAYESGMITTSAAVAITEKLCGIVSYLHEKSLLHCDIKPDNILIHGNDVFLIDFGIAHFYNKNSDGETALIGTQGYAAPELGYQKTDYRIDVYAIGMVLYYLLTGSTKIKELSEKVSDRPLRAIINHATNYEVGKRYPTCEKLRIALRKYQKGTVYRPLFSILLVVNFVLCFIAGGFLLPTVFESVNAYFNAGKPQFHQFSDPLIEQAIRISLGKSDDEPVYSHELLSVEGIYIAGDRAFATLDDIEKYRHSFFEIGQSPLYATFLSTSDIAACKNLKILSIQFHALETIDFLSETPSLRELELMYTSVSNIAILSELPKITYLNLIDCPISDLSPIENCPMLTTLKLDACPISDLSPIKKCSRLEIINLYHINAVNYDFAISDKHYNEIAIAHVPYESFMPNLSGISTSRLSVVDCGITELDVFPDMTITETLDLSQNTLINTDGTERILGDGAKIVK